MRHLEKAGGDAAKLKLARWDETDSKWTILDTSVDKGDKSLTTHTNRFSIWAIMVESAGSTSTDNTNTRNNTNWGLIAGMAAGIVLVAGGIYLFGFRWKKIRS